MNIQKGDGLVTISGARVIAMTDPFKATSHDDYDVVRVAYPEGWEMPLQLASVVEVWRKGVQVGQLEETEQLSLWGEVA